MSRNGKVLVAMSGGVDSSVAACLLKEQGYQCVGVFMWVGTGDVGSAVRTIADAGADEGSPVRTAAGTALPRLKKGCCSAGDACDARAVAARLGIQFYSVDFHAEFDRIIEYFVDEYARARTPNPCIVCNTRLKFGKLLAYADMIGAEFVATGHYARVLRGDVGTRGGGDVGTWERGNGPAAVGVDPAPGQSLREPSGNIHLARARNLAKDQSYVLFGIRRENLPRCLFPLGEIADKSEVRRIAADLGLAVHDKPDSQEICFVPNNDYRQLVHIRRPQTERPGDVLDSQGRVLGAHTGIVNYTVGQRHGLRIAAAKPMYVTRLDAATNTVVLGPREELLSDGLVAERVNWLTDSPLAGEWRPMTVKIRHMHAPVPGSFRVLPFVPAGGSPAVDDVAAGGSPAVEARAESGCTVEVRFDQPQSAVTPGQAAVFYDGDIVLGGGWIASGIKNGE